MNDHSLRSELRESDVDREIRAANSWYVADQVAVSAQPGYRLTTADRIRSFRDSVRRHASGRFVLFEAGCGDGTMLKEMRTSPQVVLGGLDYNVLRLFRALHYVDGGMFAGADLRALPIMNGSIDMVLCNQVLEHIREDTDALMELHRVLKPGGVCIVSVPNEGCLLARLRNRVLEPYIQRTTDHVNAYTESSFRRVIANTPFRIDRVERLGFFTPHQFLHKLVNRFEWSHRLMRLLGERVLPSQTASLTFELVKGRQ